MVKLLCILLSAFALFPIDRAYASADDLLRQGESLLALGQWSQAMAVFEEVVEKSASNPVARGIAHARIAKCYLELGQPRLCRERLSMIAKNYSEFPVAINRSLLCEIELLGREGNPSEAESRARSLVTKAQSDNDEEAVLYAHVKLSELLLNRSMAAVAKQYLADSINFAQDTPYQEPMNWARVMMIRALVETGATGSVAAFFEQLGQNHATGRANDSQMAWGLIWKGRGQVRERSFADAVASYQMAASLVSEARPQIAYEAMFAACEACRQHGEWAWILNRDGDTRDSKHAEALEHCLAAYHYATERQLDEGRKDRAVLQAASEMRHLGMRERAIAWLRRAIDDPADLSGVDELLANRLALFLTVDEQEQWHRYIIDPAAGTDPTAGFVHQEFNAAPSTPSRADPHQRSARHFWRACFYQSQERYGDAIAGFRMSIELSESADKVGGAYRRIAQCFARAADLERKNGNASGYDRMRELGRQEAMRCWDALLPAIRNIHGKESFALVEDAVYVFHDAGFAEAAVDAAQQLVELAPAGTPQSAWTQYMLVHMLNRTRRFHEALPICRSICENYGDASDADVREVCKMAMMAGIFAAAVIEDWSTCGQFLDEFEPRWGNLYPEMVKRYRTQCASN